MFQKQLLNQVSAFRDFPSVPSPRSSMPHPETKCGQQINLVVDVVSSFWRQLQVQHPRGTSADSVHASAAVIGVRAMFPHSIDARFQEWQQLYRLLWNMSHRNIHQTLHLLYTLWTFLAPNPSESFILRYFKHTLNMNLKMSAWKRMEKGISLGSHRFLVKLNFWIVYRTVSSSNSIDILPQRWTFRR